jgi:cysteinyl-tRNA synthetase
VHAVGTALESRDIAGALSIVGELDRTASSANQRELVRSLLARTTAAVGEPVDVTATVTPYVELLLALRDQARTDKRWAESDAIRDGLVAAGVEVRDTSDGVTWEVHP